MIWLAGIYLSPRLRRVGHRARSAFGVLVDAHTGRQARQGGLPAVEGASEHVLGAIDQFVILGAGFDPRAFRSARSRRIRCFEVDMPRTQATKQQLLRKAEIDPTGVTFVAAGFATEDWFARLIEAGFDPRQPAVFLWEGVIMYLDRGAVESTLPFAVLVFDYFTTEPLTSPGCTGTMAEPPTEPLANHSVSGSTAHPPLCDRLAELLESCGLALVEHQTLGSERDGKRAWGGFAVATVTTDPLLSSRA